NTGLGFVHHPGAKIAEPVQGKARGKHYPEHQLDTERQSGKEQQHQSDNQGPQAKPENGEAGEKDFRHRQDDAQQKPVPVEQLQIVHGQGLPLSWLWEPWLRELRVKLSKWITSGSISRIPAAMYKTPLPSPTNRYTPQATSMAPTRSITTRLKGRESFLFLSIAKHLVGLSRDITTHCAT